MEKKDSYKEIVKAYPEIENRFTSFKSLVCFIYKVGYLDGGIDEQNRRALKDELAARTSTVDLDREIDEPAAGNA